MAGASSLTIFAPAKINLYLHVCGKRDDGYHFLDSLVTFATIGDTIDFIPAAQFSFHVRGPFTAAFTAQDLDATPQSTNLVVRMAHEAARLARRPLPYRIVLTKNMPLASGIGGGSADAAATLWGLLKLWDIPVNAPFVQDLMLRLGADIPACLRSAPVRIRGIGDILDPMPPLPEMPIVLVNPLKHCPTPKIFRQFKAPFAQERILPADLSDPDDFIDLLKQTGNDLQDPAIGLVPDIAESLAVLNTMPGCVLTRMSGSGATVFALFDNALDAQDAAENITHAHPRWWVRTGTINSPERY